MGLGDDDIKQDNAKRRRLSLYIQGRLALEDMSPFELSGRWRLTISRIRGIIQLTAPPPNFDEAQVLSWALRIKDHDEEAKLYKMCEWARDEWSQEQKQKSGQFSGKQEWTDEQKNFWGILNAIVMTGVYSAYADVVISKHRRVARMDGDNGEEGSYTWAGAWDVLSELNIRIEELRKDEPDKTT